MQTLTPATGQTVVFTTTPAGSYAKVGHAYRVNAQRGRNGRAVIHLTDAATGSQCMDDARRYRGAVWHIAKAEGR